MTNAIAFQWTLHPATSARPWLHCPGCGTARPFQSTGRIRLNANGRRLDAWLIYRCSECRQRWNRPVFERRDRRSLSPDVLDACEASAADYVARIEGDLAGLRRHSARIEGGGLPEVHKAILNAPMPDQVELALHIVGGRQAPFRPDRLLARELALSRARLAMLVERDVLRFAGAARHDVRRTLSDDVTLMFRIGGLAPDERQAMLAALGPTRP